MTAWVLTGADGDSHIFATALGALWMIDNRYRRRPRYGWSYGVALSIQDLPNKGAAPFGKIALLETMGANEVETLAAFAVEAGREAAIFRIGQRHGAGRVSDRKIGSTLFRAPFVPAGRQQALHDAMKFFDLRTAKAATSEPG